MKATCCLALMGVLLFASPGAWAQTLVNKPESTGGNPAGTWQADQVPFSVYVSPELLAIVSNLNFSGSVNGSLTLDGNGKYQSDLITKLKASFSLSFGGQPLPISFDVADTNRTQGSYTVLGAQLVLIPDTTSAVPDTVAFTAAGDSLVLVQPLSLGSYAAYLGTLPPPLAVIALKQEQTGPVTADFSGDGVVDFEDFLMFASHFGQTKGGAGYDAVFDLDGNGTVGFSDFVSFVSQFGRHT